MLRYVIRRLVGAVLVVFVVSLVTFLIFQVGPRALGTNPAYLYVGKVTSPAQIKAVEHRLGFDQPIPQQYVTYVKGIVAGRTFTDGSSEADCPAPCFGYSFRLNTNVTSLLVDRFSVTLSLALGATVLWLFFGVGVGVLSALRRGSAVDRVAMIISLAGVSLPIYFTGYVLELLFIYGPVRVFQPPSYVPINKNPLEWASNLVLPWVALAFLFAALYARLSRANMLETLGEDYIRTATAKGLPRTKVIGKHALRAALTPIVTILGMDFATLIGGSTVITEKVFNLPGLGALSINAIGQQDLPIIMGVTILASIFIVFANIIVDVLYGVIDPRVRYA